MAACSLTTWAGGIATASTGATRVPLDAYQRRCDFGRDGIAPLTPSVALGTGMVLVHTAGSQVVADVELVDAPAAGTHFDVELIQVPHSGGCAPGQPGVTFGGLDTDAAGRGTVTIQDALRPGTTGVWVTVQRPNEHSQNPAEAYSSEFIAPV